MRQSISVEASNINWDATNIFYDGTLAGTGTKRTFTFSKVRAGRIIIVVLNLSSYTGTITRPALYAGRRFQGRV